MKKMKLNELEVKSFVTSLDNQKINTVKGGTSVGCAVTAGMVTAFTLGVTAGITIATIVNATKNGVDPNDTMCNTNLSGCHQTQQQ